MAVIGTVVSGFHVQASVYALGAIAIVPFARAIFSEIIQQEKERWNLWHIRSTK